MQADQLFPDLTASSSSALGAPSGETDSKLPDHAAPPPPKKKKKKEGKTTETRGKIILELITTENTYVNQLKLLSELFVTPLSEQGVLTAVQIQTIFSTSDLMSIITLNSQLLDTLKVAMRDFDYKKTCIGKDFLQFTQYLKMYKNYVNNHDASNKLLSELKSKLSRFDSFINKTLSDSRCRGLTLEAFIILPIQRIPRYELFFRDLLKHTGRDHPDHDDLQLCFTEIMKINGEINENMKQFERRQKVRDIENRCNPRLELIQPARVFIREGQLTKVSRRTDIRYNFVLFSDLLMYAAITEVGSGPLKVHCQMPFDRHFDVVDVEGGSKKYGFCVFEIHSTVKSFLVVADSPGERRDWYNAIRECLDNMRKGRQDIGSGDSDVLGDTQLKHTQPVWFPDDFSDACMMERCRKKFNFTRRRHHCRYCGKLICNDCSKEKLPNLDRTKKEWVRVCDTCFVRFKKLYDQKDEEMPAITGSKKTFLQTSATAVGTRSSTVGDVSEVTSGLVAKRLSKFTMDRPSSTRTVLPSSSKRESTLGVGIPKLTTTYSEDYKSDDDMADYHTDSDEEAAALDSGAATGVSYKPGASRPSHHTRSQTDAPRPKRPPPLKSYATREGRAPPPPRAPAVTPVGTKGDPSSGLVISDSELPSSSVRKSASRRQAAAGAGGSRSSAGSIHRRSSSGVVGRSSVASAVGAMSLDDLDEMLDMYLDRYDDKKPTPTQFLNYCKNVLGKKISFKDAGKAIKARYQT